MGLMKKTQRPGILEIPSMNRQVPIQNSEENQFSWWRAIWALIFVWALVLAQLPGVLALPVRNRRETKRENEGSEEGIIARGEIVLLQKDTPPSFTITNSYAAIKHSLEGLAEKLENVPLGCIGPRCPPIYQEDKLMGEILEAELSPFRFTFVEQKTNTGLNEIELREPGSAILDKVNDLMRRVVVVLESKNTGRPSVRRKLSEAYMLLSMVDIHTKAHLNSFALHVGRSLLYNPENDLTSAILVSYSLFNREYDALSRQLTNLIKDYDVGFLSVLWQMHLNQGTPLQQIFNDFTGLGYFKSVEEKVETAILGAAYLLSALGRQDYAREILLLHTIDHEGLFRERAIKILFDYQPPARAVSRLEEEVTKELYELFKKTRIEDLRHFPALNRFSTKGFFCENPDRGEQIRSRLNFLTYLIPGAMGGTLGVLCGLFFKKRKMFFTSLRLGFRRLIARCFPNHKPKLAALNQYFSCIAEAHWQIKYLKGAEPLFYWDLSQIKCCHLTFEKETLVVPSEVLIKLLLAKAPGLVHDAVKNQLIILEPNSVLGTKIFDKTWFGLLKTIILLEKQCIIQGAHWDIASIESKSFKLPLGPNLKLAYRGEIHEIPVSRLYQAFTINRAYLKQNQYYLEAWQVAFKWTQDIPKSLFGPQVIETLFPPPVLSIVKPRVIPDEVVTAVNMPLKQHKKKFTKRDERFFAVQEALAQRARQRQSSASIAPAKSQVQVASAGAIVAPKPTPLFSDELKLEALRICKKILALFKMSVPEITLQIDPRYAIYHLGLKRFFELLKFVFQDDKIQHIRNLVQHFAEHDLLYALSNYDKIAKKLLSARFEKVLDYYIANHQSSTTHHQFHADLHDIFSDIRLSLVTNQHSQLALNQREILLKLHLSDALKLLSELPKNSTDFKDVSNEDVLFYVVVETFSNIGLQVKKMGEKHPFIANLHRIRLGEFLKYCAGVRITCGHAKLWNAETQTWVSTLYAFLPIHPTEFFSGLEKLRNAADSLNGLLAESSVTEMRDLSEPGPASAAGVFREKGGVNFSSLRMP